MPITATRTTTFAPGGDQDGDTFVDFGDVLRHTLVISNSGTPATGVVVNDPLNGSTLTGSVNVSPLAFDDTFAAVGNTLLEVGNATAQTGPQTSFAGSVISNDVEFLGDTFSISALQATAVAGSTVSATSAGGGSVTMITTGADAGSFTYVSAAGFNGADTFTYTIRDKGLDGIAGNADDLTSVGTVTINVANKVWYVDSSAAAGGNGTSTNPFNTFASVNGAGGVGDVDGSNDTISFKGTLTANVELEAGQKLIGSGSALVVGADTLLAAGTQATLTHAGVGVLLSSGNTVTGLNIVGNNDAGTGISDGGGTVGTLTVSNVGISGQGGIIDIDQGGALAVTLNSAASASSTGANGGVIDLGGDVAGTGVTGTFTVTGTTTIGGSQAQDAINIGGAVAGTNLAASFGGLTTVNPTGATNGIAINNNAGSDSFAGLSVTTSSGNAFVANTAGTLTVTDPPATTTQLTSTTGTTLSINGATVGVGGITFDSVSHNGAGTGVSLANVTQAAGSTGIDINGGTIAGATVRGVDIDTTQADVSVAASIGDTAAGRTVEVTNSGRAGGSIINFSGAIDENGTGINLDNNDQNTNGATINFTGGMDIDSAGANFGFNATNGGTVNVTGTNTIDTGAGIGLNVSGSVANGFTTIGGSGLTFQHISVNGATNGIVLNGTGAGGLTVTGDAGSAVNASGGVIQNTSGVGILLTSANNINLDQLTVQNGGNDGINGTTVNNFALTNSTVSGNGNGNDENGIEFTGLTGAATISNDTVHNSYEDNFRLLNTGGTLDSLNIKNSVFDQTSILTTGGNGVVATLQGAAVLTDLSISGSTFRNNYSNGILVNTENTSRIGLDNATNASTHGSVVSGNTFDDNNIAIQFGVFNASDQTVDIQNNTIINDQRRATSGTNSASHAIVVGSSALAAAGSTLNARIEGNVIGSASFAGSGSSIGDGMRVIVQGLTDGTILINNNTIRETPDGFGIEATFLGPQDDAGVVPTSDVTITNNTVLHANAAFNPGASDFPLEAIYVAGDNQGGAAGAPTVHAQISGNTVPTSLAGFGFVGQFANDWIAAYEYSGASPGNLSLVDTGAASGSAIAELQQANGNNANVYSEANVSLIGGPLNLPADLTPLPLQVVAPPPPPETPPAGSGDPTPPAGQPDPTPPAGSGEPGPVVVDDGVLTPAELALIVDAAIDRWAAAGASVEQLAEMRAVTVTVENLAGLNIGLSYDGRIVVDDNAGGYNWFVDSTPGDDSEYAGDGTLLVAPGHTLAGDRVDLLTTVMHELGHQIGLTDIYAPGGAAELMYGTIFIGERRLPGGDDAAAGDGTAATGSPLALTPVTIGNIPAGKSITMQWDSTLDTFGAGLAPTYTNVSTITGSSPATSNTETLSTTSTLKLDSLTLGGTVWNDNGNGGGTANNGIQDGAEPTVNGVALTLFVDSNLSGAWDAGDVQVATTTSAGGGLYSFSGLGPGDYIVRVDQANFNAGGALLALQASSVTSPEPPNDPDNNVDNDDSGSRAAGQPAYSGAITLAFDSEPSLDLSGKLDVNNTLDFGFTALNTAPTSTSLSGDTATFTEGDAPVALDVAGNATISDTTSADFGGGSLTIAITAGGVAAEDVLTLAAAGTITFDATTVSASGIQFATYTGGSGGTPLVFAFDPDATPAAVQALVHAIRYTNTGGDNPTDGDRTLTWTLVDGDGTSSGGADTLTVSTTVNVDPVADAPVAQPDAVTTAENVVLSGGVGALFANNGSGVDVDVDGPALSISAVNGVGANVGAPITLASGALLTVNADGSYSYDPNGKFNYLVSTAIAGSTGAVNDTGTDSFTYTLTGGNTVTVTMTVTGVDGAGDQLWGDGGNNTIVGTGAGDLFNLSQGGSDTATGLGGNDGFYMGAALSAGDSLDGGAGVLDQLGLQGNYGSPFVLSANHLVNIEMLVLLSGSDARFGDTSGNTYSYNLATVDANVAAGERLVVTFNTLHAGENVTFDGSAETDGWFFTFAGLGNDAITGGAQDDGFYFGNNGRWGAGDSVDGGAGSDQLGLQGDYSGASAITFGASQITGVEMLVLLTGGDARFGNPAGIGYSYDLTMNDGNVAAGETLYVSANTLRAGVSGVTDETLTFNGSAESDGRFTIYSGAANDTLTGGANNDTIYGGGGADTMTGGAGNDTFAYMSAAHSTLAATDQILDFATGDKIDLSAIDAITGGANDAFSFIGSGAFSNTAGELRAFDTGGGVWQVQGDINGDGTADLVIAVTTGAPLVTTDFVL